MQVMVTVERRECRASRSGSMVVRLKRAGRSVETAKFCPDGLPPKAVLWQVEEASGALQVGEGSGSVSAGG